MYEDRATESVWEQLRATRWSPPGAATLAVDRRATFVFALEQAEQMFRAAATVGLATRPVHVYYGLNQAGRTIAAAASAIKSGEGWKLRGHGISAVRLERDLPDIELRTDKDGGRGSFVRLSELLDSPVWIKAPVRLGELWDVLPENRAWPLGDIGDLRRTPLRADRRSLHRESHPLVSVPVYPFPPWVLNADDKRKALDTYLQSFPGAGKYDSFLRVGMEADSEPALEAWQDGWGELLMHWELPNGQIGTESERHAYLETLTRRYDGALYFFPALAVSGRSLHPLMAWWAVLYALSILARYQPAEWAAHINVDSSPYAVPIERLLKEAIRVLPRLVAEAIDQVTR